MKLLELLPYTVIEDENFSDQLIFRISKGKFTGIVFNDRKPTFSFRNCKFKKIVIENAEDIEFENIVISFSNCYIEDVEVENVQSKGMSILFHACLLKGKIQNDNIKTISFNNCIIIGSIFLIKIKNINVSYTEENIFPICWRKLLKKANLDLNDVLKRKQEYRVYDCFDLAFSSNEKVSEERGLYKTNYNELNDYRIGCLLTKSQKDLLNINLYISCSPEIDNKNIRLVNSQLESLSLSGYLTGSVSIDSMKINNLYIRDFSAGFGVSFYNISPFKAKGSKIEIHKSNLDKSWFDNVSFSSYELISFYRTKFGKTTFTSCDFPSDSTSFERFKTLKNVHYPEDKPDKYYKDQYEIFLQLKVQLEGTGNFYESQKLHAISNDALMGIEGISYWDKFILYTNSISNNHGLSIARPLKWFALFSFILYILYLISIKSVFLNTDFDPIFIGYYFSFIDLTHRNDFLVSKNEFNAWSLSIDYINKILTSYFIYQFISAFRKYGKK